MLEKLIRTFTKSSKLSIILLIVIALLVCIIPLKLFQKNLFKTTSIDDAKLYTLAIAKFRTIYSREVITKVEKLGIKVSHEFQGKPDTIPLPATFSMLLGQEIAKQRYGGEINLYSAYPFPWRAKSEGLKDNFRKESWKKFQNKIHTEHYRFTEENGNSYIRYSVPDLMRNSCIQCHNSHPDTPKKGWKVGDVRGVLEVKRPVSQITENISSFFNKALLQLFIGISIFLFILYFLLESLNRKIKKLDLQKATIQEQQQQLIETSKMSALGDMAGGLAHEINNPLGTLTLTLNQIKQAVFKKNVNSELVNEMIEDAENSTKRISKIVKSVKAYSRNGANDGFIFANIKEIIENSITLSSSTLKALGISLTFKHAPHDDWPIECNPTQISQIILNLIQNSKDAIEPKDEKWIKIELEEIADHYVICLIDSGDGIPKDVYEKLFDPFFTTKDIGKGTGLGLSMCLGFARGHNGKLEYLKNSEKTTFVVTLPKFQDGVET